MSLSARRAWIEISHKDCHHQGESVALRKESVDRNSNRNGRARKARPSLSARRAWIEIFISVIRTPIGCVVALRKESVDRNYAECLKL